MAVSGDPVVFTDMGAGCIVRVSDAAIFAVL
jgi:hypothetical protein